jgi:hypothetical protein
VDVTLLRGLSETRRLAAADASLQLFANGSLGQQGTVFTLWDEEDGTFSLQLQGAGAG